MKAFRFLLLALAVLAFLAAIVSLIPTDWWLVRALDLIREPMIYLMLAVLLIALALGSNRRWLIAALLATAIVINIWRIWPYWALSSEEIPLLASAGDSACFTALSANVKMENEGYAELISQIEAADPDIVLLTETDRRWADRLQPLLDKYPHVRAHPQPDTFGKVFASRLPVIDTDIYEERGEDTPTVFAVLRADEDNLIEFIGIHPKAPLPGQDTEERDRTIIDASDEGTGQLTGGIVMGDFNDVPWSRTTTRFREQGGWRDPRIGRGTYPTFPSRTLPLGWPLDQIMVKGKVGVRSFEVMDDNGSDHRALFGEFCVAS